MPRSRTTRRRASNTSGSATNSGSGIDDHYINYVEPRVAGAFDTSDDHVVADQQGNVRGAVSASAIERAKENDQKHAQGNPVAARQLAATEAKAVKTGKSPKNLKQSKTTQQAKLLTILVEFDGTDDTFGASPFRSSAIGTSGRRARSAGGQIATVLRCRRPS
jgi:immune inhibitor A